MTRFVSQLCAAVGGCAVVAAAAIGAVAVFDGHDSNAVAAPTGNTESAGATEKPSTAPSTPVVSMAVPAIKGPAPLPPEEQGLPG
jgi:hypothetical protein